MKSAKKASVYLFCIMLAMPFVSGLSARDMRTCDFYVDPFGDTPREAVQNFLGNMYLVMKEAVSLDSMLILTAFTPFYLGARMTDEEIHRGFYDSKYHKNKDYPHKCLEWSTHGSMIFPIMALGGLMQFSSDPRVRLTGGVAFSGVVITQITNQLIKHIWATQPIRAACRPLNEHFCPHKRVYNGFPSGHALGCAYIAVLCGLQLGAKWAIPVGGICALIAGLTIQCNRHYASQVVAGAGVGTIFAVASSKVVNAKYSCYKNVDFKIACDSCSRPCLEASISF